MINHVRTILLNEHAVTAGPATGLPFAEFIPPEFGQYNVPDALAPIYSAIFPAPVPVSNKLERIAGVMALLHAPPLSRYVTFFDARITYLRAFSNTASRTHINLMDLAGTVNAASTSVNAIAVLFADRTGEAYIRDMYRVWATGLSPLSRAAATMLAYAWNCSRMLKLS